MTRLVILQNPERVWCFSCNENGQILDVMPSSLLQYVGSNISEVQLIAASILRYWVEEVNDNEYPTSFEITHDGRVSVIQSGLRMRFAESYGSWNNETQSLNKYPV